MSEFPVVVFNGAGVAHRESCVHAPYRDVERMQPAFWHKGHPGETGKGWRHILMWIRACRHCRPDVPESAA